MTKPKEIGYFVAPTQAKPENGGQASDFAMSQPAFVPERHEVWFTDGTSGFYALKVADAVWPKGDSAVAGCKSTSRVTVTLHLPRGAKLRKVTATSRGKSVKVVRVRRKGRTLRVTLQTKRGGNVAVRALLKGKRPVKTTALYRPCPTSG